MAILFVKRYYHHSSSSTWSRFPTIGGSRYGFIGLIAGIAALLLLIFLIACICCIKRSRNKEKMRKAAVGGDLQTYHPPPTFGRHGSSSKKIQFVPMPGLEEPSQAYPAKSPRTSDNLNGAPYPTHTANQSSYDYNSANGTMNGMNQKYYRGSEGFRQDYTPSPGPHQATSDYSAGGATAAAAAGHGGYDYGYGGGSERFAEPQYDPSSYGGEYPTSQQQQYGGMMSSHSQNPSYDQYGNPVVSRPSSAAPQMPMPAMTSYNSQPVSGSYYQTNPEQGAYEGSYPTNTGSPGPNYIDYQRSTTPRNRLPGTEI